MTNKNSESDTRQRNAPMCIRCDKVVAEDHPEDLHDDYITLPFHQQSGFLPICMDCFDEVRDRDLRKL